MRRNIWSFLDPWTSRVETLGPSHLLRTSRLRISRDANVLVSTDTLKHFGDISDWYWYGSAIISKLPCRKFRFCVLFLYSHFHEFRNNTNIIIHLKLPTVCFLLKKSILTMHTNWLRPCLNRVFVKNPFERYYGSRTQNKRFWQSHERCVMRSG